MTDNRTTELLPCPFCGGEADEYEGDYGNGIYCMMCGAMVGEPIHLEYRTTKRVSIDEAIAAWNARAQTVFGMTLDEVRQMMKRDAERERTCEIEHVKGGAMYDVWRYTCCGYEYAESVSETGIVQNYCPNCGARRVDA